MSDLPPLRRRLGEPPDTYMGVDNWYADFARTAEHYGDDDFIHPHASEGGIGVPKRYWRPPEEQDARVRGDMELEIQMCFIRAHERAEADWYGDHEAREALQNDPATPFYKSPMRLLAGLLRPQRRPARSGNVYLAEAVGIPGLYKIGQTIHPTRRFQGMGPVVQIIHIIAVSDMDWAEDELHAQFGALRIEGTEWFNLRPQDVEWVCSLTSLEPED